MKPTLENFVSPTKYLYTSTCYILIYVYTLVHNLHRSTHNHFVARYNEKKQPHNYVKINKYNKWNHITATDYRLLPAAPVLRNCLKFIVNNCKLVEECLTAYAYHWTTTLHSMFPEFLPRRILCWAAFACKHTPKSRVGASKHSFVKCGLPC